MHSGIAVDTSSWPLVIKRVGNQMALEDMTRYLKEMDGLLAKKQPFSCVVLVRQKGNLDRRTIQEYGAWVKKNQAAMKQYYLGAAFIFPGEIFRFILSAILLAAPAPVPHAVFGKDEDACEWAMDKLIKAGITPPSFNPKLVSNGA